MDNLIIFSPLPTSGDRMGNFDIQYLMSQYNQSETLASSVQKKRDDTANAIIRKVG